MADAQSCVPSDEPPDALAPCSLTPVLSNSQIRRIAVNREIARAKLAASRSRASSSSSCNETVSGPSPSSPSSSLPSQDNDPPPDFLQSNAPSAPEPRRRCCKCCQTGRCVRCSCVTAGRRCVGCYPSRSGSCSNLNHPTNNPDLANSSSGSRRPSIQQPPACTSSSCQDEPPDISSLSPAPVVQSANQPPTRIAPQLPLSLIRSPLPS